MASQLRRAVPLLEYLDSLNSKARKKFLNNANKKVIETIVDVLHNINIGTIPLDKNMVDRLRLYKENIKSITVAKKSLVRRRRELVDRDVFFKRIFPVLLPALIRIIVPKPPSSVKVERSVNDGVESPLPTASAESQEDMANQRRWLCFLETSENSNASRNDFKSAKD